MIMMYEYDFSQNVGRPKALIIAYYVPNFLINLLFFINAILIIIIHRDFRFLKMQFLLR